MEPSTYQMAIYEHFERGQGHSAVIAVAGSGKTTTAIDCVGHTSMCESILMAAFNTDIKIEFTKRLTAKGFAHVKAMTFNGFGWGICMKNMQTKPEMDVDKTERILEFKVLQEGDTQLRKLIPPVKKMIGLLKSYCVLDMARAELEFPKLMDHYNIEEPEDVSSDYFKEIVMKTFKASNEHTAHFDFDDQKYMPLLMGWNIPRYDQVLVDEFQDTCPVEMNLLWGAAKGGRFHGFGDPDQAIYGFKGATPDAFDKYIEVSKATVLPLSICYRCPKAVIAEAKKIVPRIEHAPNAIEGVVDWQQEEYFYDNCKPGDFVLCRTNDELVSKAIHFIRKKKAAKIRGRDFGTGIEMLMDRITRRRNIETADFITMLMEYQIERCDQLAKLRRESEIVRLQDRVNTVQALMDGAKNTDEGKATLRTIFTDAAHGGIDLMTTHKSKGLQAKRVWILRPDLMPHPAAAEKPWMMKEETRLKYVAITRAEEELHWVIPPKKKKGGS